MTWAGHTPHPTEGHYDETAEVLWVAQSNSGDYHKNMTSERFMMWVENRLAPTFQRLYPNKKMILCLDNAAYHHNRGVPSLSTISSKPSMLKLMQEHSPQLTQLTLPKKKGVRANPRTVAIGQDMLQKATKNRPDVPTLDEMKEAWLSQMAAHPTLKAKLECKLENFLKTEGIVDETGGFLWTPPYTPSLQPIEEFWAAGKNYAAEKYTMGRTMTDCVAHLREGWYGNAAVGKQAARCHRLVERAQEDADRRIAEVGGLTGSMRDGVQVVDGAKVFAQDDSATDMTAKPESWDLTGTADDEDEPGTECTLGEEEHTASVVAALSTGDAEVEPDDEDAAAPAPRAPPDSPAAAAQRRAVRRRKNKVAFSPE